MARKCNLKKKPKNVLEAPAEGQESQKKVSFEVRGKKGSLHEKQEDVPGHILDQAFLVRVEYILEWLAGSADDCHDGRQGLALFHSGTTTPNPPQTIRVILAEYSQDDEGTQSFLYMKAFFISTL